MKFIEEFKSGHFEKSFGYQYFVPEYINYEWTWKTTIISELLERASIKLGELNSFARLVPNIDLFIQMHVTTEAVISSRIEGTKTKIDEAILPEAEIKLERRDDWLEVQNYIKAMNESILELKRLPVSSRLIKKAHKILLDGVRGKHKQPGEFRASQNWIGGNSLQNAVFIPPAAHLVNALMSDLEKFLNNDEIHVPVLIRIALAHYQFETIHPFLDGNGRIGRLLITLYLVSQKLLDKPLLYLSHYFDKNRYVYYDNLQRVREKNDLLNWLKFFLVGVEQTATLSVNILSRVILFKANLENQIKKNFGRRMHSAMILLNYLFREPVVNVDKASDVCEISYKAANELIQQFCEYKILKEITGQSRNRNFVFEPYLKIFNN
jgi:Fic family protein